MQRTYEVKLAEVLKREMGKGGWTIEALSHESGVPASTLREWRNGRGRIQISIQKTSFHRRFKCLEE